MIDRKKDEEFEERLAAALRHVDAPEGFAARVLALSEAAQPTTQVLMWRRWAGRSRTGSRMRMGAALAAGLMLAVITGEGVHARRVEQRRAVAEAQFETAMRVTDKVLATTRRQVSRAGFRLNLK